MRTEAIEFGIAHCPAKMNGDGSMMFVYCWWWLFESIWVFDLAYHSRSRVEVDSLISRSIMISFWLNGAWIHTLGPLSLPFSSSSFLQQRVIDPGVEWLPITVLGCGLVFGAWSLKRGLWSVSVIYHGSSSGKGTGQSPSSQAPARVPSGSRPAMDAVCRLALVEFGLHSYGHIS